MVGRLEAQLFSLARFQGPCRAAPRLGHTCLLLSTVLFHSSGLFLGHLAVCSVSRFFWKCWAMGLASLSHAWLTWYRCLVLVNIKALLWCLVELLSTHHAIALLEVLPGKWMTGTKVCSSGTRGNCSLLRLCCPGCHCCLFLAYGVPR